MDGLLTSVAPNCATCAQTKLVSSSHATAKTVSHGLAETTEPSRPGPAKALMVVCALASPVLVGAMVLVAAAVKEGIELASVRV